MNDEELRYKSLRRLPCADNRARAGGGAAGLDLMFKIK